MRYVHGDIINETASLPLSQAERKSSKQEEAFKKVAKQQLRGS